MPRPTRADADYPPPQDLLATLLREKYKIPSQVAKKIAWEIPLYLQYNGLRLIDTRPEMGPGPFPLPDEDLTQ